MRPMFHQTSTAISVPARGHTRHAAGRRACGLGPHGQTEGEDRRQRDETALAERAGHGPRLDAAGHVDLQRDHDDQHRAQSTPRRAAPCRGRPRASQISPRRASSASGVQKKRPCSVDHSTSEGVRRPPRHLARHLARRPRMPVQRLIRGKLRQIARATVAEHAGDALTGRRRASGRGVRGTRTTRSRKSSAGPAAKNSILLAHHRHQRRARAEACGARTASSASRTRSQIQRNSDTANAEQACENPGATYM